MFFFLSFIIIYSLTGDLQQTLLWRSTFLNNNATIWKQQDVKKDFQNQNSDTALAQAVAACVHM